MNKQIIDGISSAPDTTLIESYEQLKAECNAYKKVLKFYANGMGLDDKWVMSMENGAYIVINAGRRANEVLDEYQ